MIHVPALNPCNFECTLAGKYIQLITLQNQNGMKVWLTNYGARIVGALVPDQFGILRDVIPGFSNLNAYIQPSGEHYGALIGTYAASLTAKRNRLNDEEDGNRENSFFTQFDNGFSKFHQYIWNIRAKNDYMVDLCYASVQRGGLPANVLINVTFTITADNALKIKYKVTTDEPILINLTNQVFFNLNGDGNGNILRHNLKLKARYYLPLADDGIPMKDCIDVTGTPFDFRHGRSFVTSIYDHHRQLAIGNGFDHDFIWENPYLASAAAQIVPDLSGIVLKVHTDMPVLHLNTGNRLTGKNMMRSGTPDFRHTMFSLAPQKCSNSHGSANVFSNILMPGQIRQQTTIYQFSKA